MAYTEARSTIKLYQWCGNRVVDDSSASSPTIQFVNTADGDCGADGVAAP